MTDNDDLIRRPSLASRAVEPAPRIDSQPGDQPAFRPPFLLALLLSPFNLLYRLLASSFRIFGTLFPFLPRLLHSTASPWLQRSQRNTGGRRALAPKDTAARFIREFEEEYGSHSLPFLENGYNLALDKAHQELKFLLVVLLSPEHDDTSGWVRDTLLSQEVVDFIRAPENSILLWGGNVRDSDAYQVSSSLRCDKFPFAALVAHTPNVSSSAMSIISRVPGFSTPSEFVAKLRTAIAQNREPLDRARSTRAEQQASRTLREEQDSAYERSLAQDRERARQKREAAAAKEREEAEERERQALAEKREQNLAQWKLWRLQSLPGEPQPPEDKDAVRVNFRLTSGERVVRKFAPDADIEQLYAYVECYDVISAGDDDNTSSKPVSEPENFEHKYGFRLVSPMPRMVYELDAGGSVRERIGRGGNLLVETIEDDDDEDGSDGGGD